MKKILLFFAALFALTGTGEAFEVNFAKDEAGQLFDVPAKQLPKIDQGVLALPSKIETRVLPVVAGKKYKLVIAARVDDDFVIEENDRAHILTLQSHRYRVASAYSVTFQNAAGEAVPGLGGAGAGGFFLTKTLTPYTSVFYAPPAATGLKVQFQTNKRATHIAGLQLTEETEEGTINPNPDFRYGELSYSGWNPARDGRLYTRPDGKTVLNIGYAGGSPYFPLSSERKYRFSVIGVEGRLSIYYFDKDGKTILNRHLLYPKPEGTQTEIVPPPGTVFARVTTIGSPILEEFKVVEVK